jgi:hypothetical protein
VIDAVAPYLIAGIVIGWFLIVLVALALGGAAAIGDRQTVEAFRRSYGDVRDPEWPWPPKRDEAA